MDLKLPLPDHELAALPDDGGPTWNRLIFSSSPYLLQHAANPVKWWPWGDEAFDEAARLDRPVLLSIGYATCHWCHVMAHESFEDAEVAALLNEHFICIKVDREEHPDVDHVYMEACMALSGQGGWPLTAFLLPDRRVFHAGTYFPKHPSQGRHGMMSLLPVLAKYWKEKKSELEGSATTLKEELLKYQAPSDVPSVATRDRVETALHQFDSRYDRAHGGFGGAPKFPVPHQYLFLLKAGHWMGDDGAIQMARESLLSICRGGIRDHVGGGFHRYATDATWLVPHFEKMLYDQALMVSALTEAHAAQPDPRFEDAVRTTIAYVERDLKLPGGGWACGEDADSEGVEGLFYLWSQKELIDALGAERGERAARVFQTRADGNFIPEHGPASSANILHLPEPWPEDDGRDLRADLLAFRSRRIRPSRDEKILTDWNSLWCAALARAGHVFRETEWITRARESLAFLETHLFSSGRRHHRLFAGRSGVESGLDDFAAVIWARLELHQATGEEAHLLHALALEDEASNLFWEETRGAYYMRAAHLKDLPWRPLAFHDGALPSGNGLMAWNLARLWRLTGHLGLENRARLAAAAPGTSLTRSPVNHAMSLLSLYTLDGASQDVVHAGSKPDWYDALLVSRYHPNRLTRERAATQSPPSPWMSSMEIPTSGFRVWVCADRVCHRPVESKPDLEETLAT